MSSPGGPWFGFQFLVRVSLSAYSCLRACNIESRGRETHGLALQFFSVFAHPRTLACLHLLSFPTTHIFTCHSPRFLSGVAVVKFTTIEELAPAMADYDNRSRLEAWAKAEGCDKRSTLIFLSTPPEQREEARNERVCITNDTNPKGPPGIYTIRRSCKTGIR